MPCPPASCLPPPISQDQAKIRTKVAHMPRSVTVCFSFYLPSFFFLLKRVRLAAPAALLSAPHRMLAAASLSAGGWCTVCPAPPSQFLSDTLGTPFHTPSQCLCAFPAGTVHSAPCHFPSR
jgi:hypothetical protein